MRALRALLLIAAPLVAPAQADDSAEPTVKLSVKPLLCIVDDRTPQCDVSFLVTWRSDPSGSYCLFNDLEAAALRCWLEQHAGELTEDRSVDRDFRYWMTESGRDGRLAVVTVEVLRADDGDRRRRRRSRHVWDLL